MIKKHMKLLDESRLLRWSLVGLEAEDMRLKIIKMHNDLLAEMHSEVPRTKNEIV